MEYPKGTDPVNPNDSRTGHWPEPQAAVACVTMKDTTLFFASGASALSAIGHQSERKNN